MTDLESLKAAHTAAYLAAQDADCIFSAHLVRQFGKAAGDRRYDAARPGWDDATKAAGDAYVAASEARHAAWLALGEAEKAAARAPRYTVDPGMTGRRFPCAVLRDGNPYLYISGQFGNFYARQIEAERIADLLNTHGED